MKTLQETEMLSSKKDLREARGILRFTRKFRDEQGRYPTPQELPMENYEIVRYFGSYEAMLRVARLGEESLPLRKSEKKRYCRFCKELLPQHRWFFCPPIEHNEDTEQFKHSCEEKFVERDNEVLTEASKEIKRLIEKPEKRIWSRCENCEHECKIYLPVPLKEPKAKITCRADPQYQRLSEIYTYPIKKK